MNLTKLFNFSYLMQNIKKSKALIILLMALVPLFTSIVLISVTEEYVFSFLELSAVNLIGMYLIPVILSVALFGYVYKKSSVDFIGSMPISRSSIFTTNTIGGIVIIAILQLLTLICTLFLSKVLSNVIIFGSMVWDIFVFYTIAYVFVFTVANLAMTISGNRISQIIITILIIFLIPFLVLTGRAFYEESTTDWAESRKIIEINQLYHFTAPCYILETALMGDDFEYDQESMIKMFVLSLIYIGVGFVLFKKKKLEMAGEAFETRKIHLIVKLLTLLPFMAIFCSLSDDDRKSILLFFLAIVGVYYFVFDLITNKKIKLKVTIPAFLGSLVILFAYYEGIASNFAWIPDVLIEKEDVRSIVIENIRTSSSNQKKYNLLIEDEKLVEQIINNCINSNEYRYTGRVSSMTNSLAEVTIESIDDKYSIQKPQFAVEMTLKLKNGRAYKYNDYLTYETWNQILEKYGSQKAEQYFNGMRVILRRWNLTKEEENKIIDILNQTISNLTYEELYKIYDSNTTDYNLYLYEYDEHQLIKRNYSQELPKELFEVVAKICNNHAVNSLEEIYRININNENTLISKLEEYLKVHYNEYIDISSENINVNDIENADMKAVQEKYPLSQIFNLIDEYGRYYDLYEESLDELKEFIKNDYTNEFDIEKDYFVLESYYPEYMLYYTNNTDGICKILIEKYVEIIEKEQIIINKNNIDE